MKTRILIYSDSKVSLGWALHESYWSKVSRLEALLAQEVTTPAGGVMACSTVAAPIGVDLVVPSLSVRAIDHDDSWTPAFAPATNPFTIGGKNIEKECRSDIASTISVGRPKVRPKSEPGSVVLKHGKPGVLADGLPL